MIENVKCLCFEVLREALCLANPSLFFWWGVRALDDFRRSLDGSFRIGFGEDEDLADLERVCDLATPVVRGFSVVFRLDLVWV